VERVREHVPEAFGLRRSLQRARRLTFQAPWPVIAHRAEFPLALNARKLLGCAVEVGVLEGEFSELLLTHWRGLHLVSVDPWLEADRDEWVDIANVAQDEHDRLYERTKERLSRFGSRSTVWRMTGEEAATRVLDHSLDFVYLDARHDYDSVLADLESWAPKMRPGGILAGDDYFDGHVPEGVFGVKSAVQDFFGPRGLRIGVAHADAGTPSWYVVMPPPSG
jgi:Methyltransferase domain